LSDQDDGGGAMLTAVLTLDSDDQVERCMDVLARLGPDPRIAGLAAAVLPARHGDLVGRCAAQARGTPGRPGSTALLGSLARLHVAVLSEALVASLPMDSQARLSVSFDNLGELAREYGYPSQAQLIFEGALAIDRRRVDDEPGNTTYRRDLSVSFNKLADLAAEAGQGERARDLYEQALAIARRLADDEPATPPTSATCPSRSSGSPTLRGKPGTARRPKCGCPRRSVSDGSLSATNRSASTWPKSWHTSCIYR
jgi:tetratricopeptide (TPR) repeat protein